MDGLRGRKVDGGPPPEIREHVERRAAELRSLNPGVTLDDLAKEIARHAMNFCGTMQTLGELKGADHATDLAAMAVILKDEVTESLVRIAEPRGEVGTKASALSQPETLVMGQRPRGIILKKPAAPDEM